MRRPTVRRLTVKSAVRLAVRLRIWRETLMLTLLAIMAIYGFMYLLYFAFVGMLLFAGVKLIKAIWDS